MKRQGAHVTTTRVFYRHITLLVLVALAVYCGTSEFPAVNAAVSLTPCCFLLRTPRVIACKLQFLVNVRHAQWVGRGATGAPRTQASRFTATCGDFSLEVVRNKNME